MVFYKETLEYILNHSNPPKFIGFITNYKKSKDIKFDTLKKLTNTKRNNVSYVSVLVNPNDEILDKLKILKLIITNFMMLDLREQSLLKKNIIKIISSILIQKKKDVENYKFYQKFLILFYLMERL